MPATESALPAQAGAKAKTPNDREGFRQAMSWLHTWAGLVLGWLLFAIFLTGTLSFFRNELNLWTHPELHGLPATAADTETNTAEKALAALHRKVPDVTQWIMHLPDERDPAVNVLWRDTGNGRFETLRMNPQTGEAVDIRQSMGGDFFYRFHFELRTAQKGRWTLEGRWVVGVATLLMFIALLTGVVTHRRIFKDFFTFRPSKGGQRAWLDAHNVSGVLVLPFYLMITFSGLMIFHSLYLPSGIATAYVGADGKVDSNTYFADLQGDKPERRARRDPGAKVEPLPLVPVATIMAAAQKHWEGGRIGAIQARRDTKGNPVVEVTRHEGDRLQYRPPRLLFDATTAQPIAEANPNSAGITTYGVLYGLHLARFAGTGLRWTLFGFGLLGSLMIATGMVLWSVKRSAQAQRKNAAQTPPRLPLGERLVAGLNIATLAGLPLACGVFLAANRLLPLALPERADTELACFFATWALALVWGLLCPRRMGWTVVVALAAVVWALLPVLNALTTSAHLGITLPAGDWTWAGLDLAFLATGAVLGAVAWHLHRRQPTKASPTQQRPARPHTAAPQASAPAAHALPNAASEITAGT
ncbi:PepSY domain-containing protein [Acidovorax sp. 1608163]|uniref:PepSY-associated TM helix domain-containing protein n=1 Tax=Acidovorax sp. 1608163 TaxID=2478662 RepID=UPI000EF6B337|nr:PepSY-associated TM helix domain-containing protein [Acidovorax sp. 1608163]AYM98523.1 PepSY domain-containing protein [Acidovorax sp. 1608163]